MEKLKLRLSEKKEKSLFHDSKKDVRLLMKLYNALHYKVNELIDENNILKKWIEQHETSEHSKNHENLSSCENCKHETTSRHSMLCMTCLGFRNFQAKEITKK